MGIDTEGYVPDEELNKELNEGGWDGGEEGGATVRVDKNEDMERLEQLQEKEGRTADLETYLRLRKQIQLPADRVPDRLKSDPKRYLKPGSAFVYRGDEGFINIKFMDKHGDIVNVSIDPDKIAEFDDTPDRHEKNNRVMDELKKLPFDMNESGDLKVETAWQITIDLKQDYQRELEEQHKQRKTEEFDF